MRINKCKRCGGEPKDRCTWIGWRLVCSNLFCRNKSDLYTSLQETIKDWNKKNPEEII
jgi:hypothetical protein